MPKDSRGQTAGAIAKDLFVHAIPVAFIVCQSYPIAGRVWAGNHWKATI